MHSPPRTVVEAGDYIAVLEGLKQQGKIRHFGVAADSAADVEGFQAHPGITSLEVPFSIIEQDAAFGLLPKAADRGVGVISRSCFAAGLLVGDLPEDRLRELTPDWEAILAFRGTASQLGRPPKELALQFNLGIEAIAVTLVGMQTPGPPARDLAAPGGAETHGRGASGARRFTGRLSAPFSPAAETFRTWRGSGTSPR